MAAFVTFRGYGVHYVEMRLDVERVTHMVGVSFNGVSGVELHLDGAKPVLVDGYLHEVSAKVEAALLVKEKAQ